MALNDKRLDDMGTHEQIHVLEIGLRQVNNNNGLGFTILDVVINNKVLGKIIVGLATVIPSVVAAMLAMRPEIGQEVEQGLSATVGACQLSTSQQNSIENAVTEMVGAYNASCRFNISF
jgi:D-serine dehydratase